MLTRLWYSFKNFHSEQHKLELRERFFREYDQIEANETESKEESLLEGVQSQFALSERPQSSINANDKAGAQKNEECIKRSGVITSLQADHGTIDGKLPFDMKVVVDLHAVLKVGSRVEFLLYKNLRTEYLKVVKVMSVLDSSWDEIDEEVDENEKERLEENAEHFDILENKIVGLITERKPSAFIVDTESGFVSVDLETTMLDFVPRTGDRVILTCKVQKDEGFVDTQGEVLDVISLQPNRLLVGEQCTVTALHEKWATLKQSNNAMAFATFDVLPLGCQLNINDVVTADLVECDSGIFFWRCIRLEVKQKSIGQGKENIGSYVSNASPRTADRFVEVSQDEKCVLTELGQKKTVEMFISNNSLRPLRAKGVQMFDNKRTPSVHLINPTPNTPFEVPPKQKLTLVFEVEAKTFNETREKFSIEFDNLRVTRSITVLVVANEMEAEESSMSNGYLDMLTNKALQSSKNVQLRLKAGRICEQRARDIIPGPNLFSRRRFIANRIGAYDIPERLRSTYLNYERFDDMSDELEHMYPALAQPLTMDNYDKRFKLLIHLEEIEHFVHFRKYDQERAFFTHEKEFLVLEIEDLAERRPSLVIGDKVYATNPFAPDSPPYEGVINKVGFDRIYLKFSPSFHSSYSGEDYGLEFFFSRFTFRKQHYAVVCAVKHLGRDFLFPAKVNLRHKIQLDVSLDKDYNIQCRNGHTLEWHNKSLNLIQRRAVVNVLRGESENMPYVIFGPPGTGKTMTIVECILQLIKNVPSSRLLVATPSNSAADVITTRLIESNQLLPGDFVRLVSQNLVEKDLVPEELKQYCATIDMGIDGSCESAMIVTESGLKLRCQMKYLGRHRISIGTCCTLGSFHQMELPPGHFTHVIIDECGQGTEPEVMIVATQMAKKSGQVILAGDPNQLQPVITNRYAGSKGLSLSFLERVLSQPPFRKDNLRFPETSGYDPRLVTQLLCCYRSLPSILHTFNTLFYSSELRSMVNEETSPESQLVARLAPQVIYDSKARSKSHGVFFYGIRSENSQDKDSPSWYNRQEARNIFMMTVNLYRQNVAKKQIGIISPYSKQVKVLRQMFKMADVECPKIGSVEEFQGQERDIILISTVRSTRDLVMEDLKYSLGFVRCPKRMNVAISRAKSLMIVFGNPHLLCLDPSWRFFIKYCINNDAYEGCDLPGDFDIIDDPVTGTPMPLENV